MSQGAHCDPRLMRWGGHCCSGSEGHTRPVPGFINSLGGGRPDALVGGRCRGARTPVEGRCSVLTPGLSALFQRLRSQRGGHRQQDRAGDGELQRCAPPHLPPSPRGCYARGWASRSRVGALPRAGVPLPTGVPTPHSAARQSCSLSATAATLIGSSHSAVRRERGWTWRGTLGVWG